MIWALLTLALLQVAALPQNPSQDKALVSTTFGQNPRISGQSGPVLSPSPHGNTRGTERANNNVPSPDVSSQGNSDLEQNNRQGNQQTGDDFFMFAGHDPRPFYPQQERAIILGVFNTGFGRADKLVLESADLDPRNLSITDVHRCLGTSTGSRRIRCEWEDATPDLDMRPTIVVKLTGFPGNTQITIPFIMTSYKKEPDTGQLRLMSYKISTAKFVTGVAPAYAQRNPSKFPQPRAITVSALPKADDERARLRQRFTWADFEPTGFYLNPNIPLVVHVSGAVAGSKPEIVVGTPSLVSPEDHTKEVPAQLQPSGKLENGDNTISNPVGGILYIRYTHAAGQDPPPPITVTLLEGAAAQPFPLFRQGVTTNDEWKAMLRETKVPFAELAGERVIITGLAAHARSYASRGQDQQALLSTYKDIVTAHDDISGLNATAPDPKDRSSPLRPLVVESCTRHFADAGNYRVAIGVVENKDIWWQPQLSRSWKVWHELGHQRQHVKTWSWAALSEVTVNIYSLAARRVFPNIPGDTFKHASVNQWDDAKAYLAEDSKDFSTDGYFITLVMFEQLRVTFGDDFFHQLHARSRAAAEQANDADKKHFFMTQAAQIAQKNLGPYFTQWGLKPEQRTIEEMGKQPDPSEDYTARPVYGGE